MKDSKRPGGGSLPANHRKEDSRLKVGVTSRSASSKPLLPKKHLAWYVPYNANPLEKKLSGVPQIKWKCPPKLNLDPVWHVACGEESSEVRAQKYRETTVIEAVYPHPSAIPPSPLISADMEGKHDDERQIPLIPIVPIEEAGEIEVPFSTSAHVKTFHCHSTPVKQQPIPIKELASDLGVTPSRSLSIPVDESARDLSAPPAKRARICSPDLVNNWSHAQHRSDSHPPLIQDSTNGAREPEIARSRIHGATGTNATRLLTIPTPIYHENQYAGMVNQYGVPNATPKLPLFPSFSQPIFEAASLPMHPPNAAPMLPLYPSSSQRNSEAATQPMYPPPFFPGVRPVFFPPPFSSSPRPYMHCLTDGYRALDHAGLKPCLRPNPPTPFPLGVNVASSSTFHPWPRPHPYMNEFPPPVRDLTYCKSLIKQYGENHVNNEVVLPNHGQQPFNNLHEQRTNPLQTNPTVHKPCMYFNTAKGCRNGSNCRYMHG